jgi:hypothetical protein
LCAVETAHHQRERATAICTDRRAVCRVCCGHRQREAIRTLIPNPSPKRNIPVSPARFYSTVSNFPHSSPPKSRTPYQLPAAGPTCHTLLSPSLPTPPTLSLLGHSARVTSPQPAPSPRFAVAPASRGGAPRPAAELSPLRGGGPSLPSPLRRPVVLRGSSPGAAPAPVLSPGAGRRELTTTRAELRPPTVQALDADRSAPSSRGRSGGGSSRTRSRATWRARPLPPAAQARPDLQRPQRVNSVLRRPARHGVEGHGGPTAERARVGGVLLPTSPAASRRARRRNRRTAVEQDLRRHSSPFSSRPFSFPPPQRRRSPWFLSLHRLSRAESLLEPCCGGSERPGVRYIWGIRPRHGMPSMAYRPPVRGKNRQSPYGAYRSARFRAPSADSVSAYVVEALHGLVVVGPDWREHMYEQGQRPLASATTRSAGGQPKHPPSSPSRPPVPSLPPLMAIAAKQLALSSTLSATAVRKRGSRPRRRRDDAWLRRRDRPDRLRRIGQMLPEAKGLGGWNRGSVERRRGRARGGRQRLEGSRGGTMMFRARCKLARDPQSDGPNREPSGSSGLRVNRRRGYRARLHN